MAKIWQWIREGLRGPFVDGNEQAEYPETFREELNEQCGRLIFVTALIVIFVWLPYIPIDLQLQQGETFIVVLRIGLSLMGLIILILQAFKRFHSRMLILLVILGAYLEIATGVITGLAKADPAYMGGYLFVLTLLVLAPIPMRAAWAILAVSLASFFIVGFAGGMIFDSAWLRYSLNNLFATVVVVAFFIYLLDRLRYNNWNKSKKIEQQNEALKSDNARIDELLRVLQLSETRYHQLFDHSPIGIFLTTAEGKVLTANRATLSLLKFKSVDEVNATGLLNLYTDPKARTLLWEKVKSGPVSGFETVFRRNDGELISVSIGGYLTCDEAGNAALLEGTIEDITERKRAEEALRESEDRLRTIVEGTRALLVSVNHEGRITYANEATAETLGYATPAEITGRSYLHFVHPDDRQDLLDRLVHQINAREQSLIHEFRVVDTAGRIKWFSFVSTLTFHDGQFIGQTGVAQNITERKRAEEALRESEENYKFLVENTNDIIWSFDLKAMCYTFCSNAVERLLGYTPEESAGMRLDDIFSPENKKVVQERFGTVLTGGDPSGRVLQEVEHIAKNKSRRWMEINAVVKRNPYGVPLAFNGVTRDITARKKIADELQIKNAQLAMAMNVAQLGPWELDIPRRCFIVNDQIYELYKTTAGREGGYEIPLDVYLNEFVLPDDAAVVAEEIAKASAPGSTLRSQAIDCRVIRRDGEIRNMMIRFVMDRDEQGVLTRVYGINQDITDRIRAEKALRESEEKYRLLTANSNDVIWTTDTELRFTYYSPAVRKLRGLEPEEAVKKTLAETVTPASLNAIISMYQHSLPDIEKGLNPTAVMEVEQYRKDGSTVWVEISVTTMRDERGNLTGLVGATRDISARKLAENELHLRNILLSTQQEVSIDGILVVDEKGTIISFNRRFVEIWAIPNDVVESKSDERALQSVIGNLVDPDGFIAKVKHLYENRSETSRDEIALKDGRVLDRYSAPMLGDDGKYYGRIWYFRDITERKRSEQALHESERRLADIINFLPIATMVIDRDSRITAWNRAMEAITGVKREDMMGKGDYEYALPFYGERRPILIDRVLVTDPEISAPYSNVQLAKGVLSAESFIPKLGIILVGYASKLHDSEGNVVGAIESIYNITDIRRVEAELKDAKKAADAANQAKSIFLANMSHEIRTPMNAILGFAQLLQHDADLSTQSREYLHIINRSGEHLLALINNILEMSKIEAGRATFVPNPFDLGSLLHDLEMMFQVRTAEKKLMFLLEKAGDVPRWIVADEGKLRQVIINLLGNAMKFTDEGGITLRVRGVTGKANRVDLQFEVEDTGPGLSEEEVSRLFQAFEQTRTGIKSGGTGLGLALSRGFIQMMGGSISVTSAIGKGTTFRVTIPVAESREEPPPPPDKKRRVQRLKPGQQDMRVLIADDMETNRLLLSRLLERAGFLTREATDGEQAVQAVRDWKPQVVLMDLTMPVMDGYEAIRIIKASPDIKDTPVIAVTASAFEEDRSRVLAAGADGYLSKPFKDADLFENISRLTGVDYLYEGAEPVDRLPAAGVDPALLQKIVNELPSGLAGQIRTAVEGADLDRINELANQLAGNQPILARRMQEMAARYEYEALIELFSREV